MVTDCMRCAARYAVMAGLSVLCTAVRAADPEPVGLYDYPRLHMQQSFLRVQLMQAVRTGNITNMEAICRRGLALMPGDATWQYNLACALAYRATPDAALDALELAVKAGFRNAQAIENDNDLKRISSTARFKSIVRLARETAGLPVPGRPAPRQARLTMGAADPPDFSRCNSVQELRKEFAEMSGNHHPFSWRQYFPKDNKRDHKAVKIISLPYRCEERL